MTRYYDPKTGRFINTDTPDYLDPETLGGLNLYAYCNNNPVMFVDPIGHFPWLALAVALLLFTPVGGVALQAAVTTVSYVGISVASLVDEDIKKDMDKIGWNPFNDDATISSSPEKVSFYKGVPIFMVDGLGGSFSFGVIGLDKTYHKGDIDVLNHERGHSTQLMTMGLIKYGLFIAIPSPIKNDDNTPWELSASMLGGSSLGASRATSQNRIDAMRYYAFACSNNILLWIMNMYCFLSWK